jgi:hypothetical protein
MDNEFAQAVEANAHEFAGVDAFQLFGQKIDAGFSYDITGKETTYSTDNKVILSPDDSD